MSDPERDLPSLGLHTREEAAAAAGVEPELIDSIWRAAGLPSPESGLRRFTDLDVENFRGFAVGADLFGEEAVLRFTRVLGQSLSRIAEAWASAPASACSVSRRRRWDKRYSMKTDATRRIRQKLETRAKFDLRVSLIVWSASNGTAWLVILV